MNEIIRPKLSHLIAGPT